MSAPASQSNVRMILWLAFSLALPLPWLLLSGHSIGNLAIASLTGIAIVGAAFLLSW